MFNIAPATEKDIPAIIEIAEKTWWRAYSQILAAEQIRYMLQTIYAPETLRSQIVNAGQAYLVLTEHGVSVGFASFGQKGQDSGVYKIHKLYVLPEYQNKGYGLALIDDIKARLAQRNISAVELNVNRFNPARHFYERLGFKIIREEDIPIGPYWMNDYVMQLEF